MKVVPNFPAGIGDASRRAACASRGCLQGEGLQAEGERKVVGPTAWATVGGTLWITDRLYEDQGYFVAALRLLSVARRDGVFERAASLVTRWS